MYTEIYLGKEVLEPNEYGEKEKKIVYSDVSLFCNEKSVKYTEFYQAMSTGLKPEKLVSMNKYEYYQFMGKARRRFAKVVHSITGDLIEYTILREYEKDSDDIELTLTRGVEDVSS